MQVKLESISPSCSSLYVCNGCIHCTADIQNMEYCRAGQTVMVYLIEKLRLKYRAIPCYFVRRTTAQSFIDTAKFLMDVKGSRLLGDRRKIVISKKADGQV